MENSRVFETQEKLKKIKSGAQELIKNMEKVIEDNPGLYGKENFRNIIFENALKDFEEENEQKKINLNIGIGKLKSEVPKFIDNIMDESLKILDSDKKLGNIDKIFTELKDYSLKLTDTYMNDFKSLSVDFITNLKANDLVKEVSELDSLVTSYNSSLVNVVNGFKKNNEDYILMQIKTIQKNLQDNLIKEIKELEVKSKSNGTFDEFYKENVMTIVEKNRDMMVRDFYGYLDDISNNCIKVFN